MQKTTFLFLIFCACQSVNLEVPKIPRSQLAPIIGELRILESSYALRYQQVDSSNTGVESYQEEIFKRYQISRSDVTQSVEFYAARPDSMKALDSLVLIWLEVKAKEHPSPVSPQIK